MVNLSFGGISRFSYNLLFRRRQAPLLLCAFVFILYVLVTLEQLSRHHRDDKSQVKEVDILSKRSDIHNSVYTSLQNKLVESDVQKNCIQYFREFGKLTEKRSSFGLFTPKSRPSEEILSLEEIHNFRFDRLVYLKRKYLREKNREWKISHKGEKIDSSIHEQIEEEFRVLSENTADYEKKMVQTFHHMRIWGKCNLETENSDKQDKVYSKYEKGLHPWISSRFPIFENWKGERLPEGQLPIYQEKSIIKTKSFFKDLRNKSNGKGIVIPIYHHKTNEKRSKSLDNLRRFIRVLRGLNNTLPIQIIHSGSDLNPHDKKQIVAVARDSITLPKSSVDVLNQKRDEMIGNFLDQNLVDESQKEQNEEKEEKPKEITVVAPLPEQDVWFVNIDSTLDYDNYPAIRDSDIYNSSNFRHAISSIFNSFEEYVLFGSHVIPLVEDINRDLFQDQRYKETGITLFKGPSAYSSKLLRLKPSFQEINDLVKTMLFPSADDSKYFGIHQRSSNTASDRVLHQHYQSMLDPSLVVINKSKLMNGLLIGANVLLHTLLNARFFPASTLRLHDDLNPEFFWLGQEMAGTLEKVNFHINYAASVGVLTPRHNIPPKTVTMAHELCSASWAQVDENDKTKIIFVTSHQLENWKDNDYDFKISFRDKFTIEGPDYETLPEDKKEDARKVNDFYELKLWKNPLYIETVMLPPTIKEPYYETEYREPNEAWMLQHNFGSARAYHYWCTYDIVGNPIIGARGVMTELNKAKKAKYNYLVDLWLETDKN